MATPTLMMLIIDHIEIIPARLMEIPHVVPPFPIIDVVGFELIFSAIIYAPLIFNINNKSATHVTLKIMFFLYPSHSLIFGSDIS